MINTPTTHKKKVLLIGIAGTSKDFLLSLPTLKCSVLQQEEVVKCVDIDIIQYYYIEKDTIEESCNKILNDIKEKNPDLVGFSVYVWNYLPVSRLVYMVKDVFPEIKIVLGGPEIDGKDIINGRFNELQIDFLICGEGESPFLDLIRHLFISESKNESEIHGLAYRVKNYFKYNPPTNSFNYICNLPSPYLTGVIPKSLLSQPGMRANIETQRGCNFRCAYCMYHKNFPNIRYRDASVVIEEIEYIFKNGVKEFRIVDANFFSRSDFALGILRKMISKNIRMSFFVEVVPSFINDDIAEAMAEYQSLSPDSRITVGLGLQSINKKSLQSIRRSFNIEVFNRTFDLLTKANVIIKTDIILGLPYETQQTYFQLLEYIIEKMRFGSNYLSLSLLRILPGTDLEEIAKKEGLIIDNSNSEHFVYSTPYISREELVACMRINTVAFRFFSTLDIQSRKKVREKYFEVKDEQNIKHIGLLQHFSRFFLNILKESGSDFVKNDFPNAENYYARIHMDISDDILLKELAMIKDLNVGIEKRLYSKV